MSIIETIREIQTEEAAVALSKRGMEKGLKEKNLDLVNKELEQAGPSLEKLRKLGLPQILQELGTYHLEEFDRYRSDAIRAAKEGEFNESLYPIFDEMKTPNPKIFSAVCMELRYVLPPDQKEINSLFVLGVELSDPVNCMVKTVDCLREPFELLSARLKRLYWGLAWKVPYYGAGYMSSQRQVRCEVVVSPEGDFVKIKGENDKGDKYESAEDIILSEWTGENIKKELVRAYLRVQPPF